MSSSDGGDIGVPDVVVVLLCVLGSAFLCCAGYAIHRVLNPSRFVQPNWNVASESQHAYMLQVRRRNLGWH